MESLKKMNFCQLLMDLGIYKISKKRFKHITNIDINNVHSGDITSNKTLNLFNFNLPDPEPYNRFQYWLETMKF